MVVVVQSLNRVRLSVTSWTKHTRLPCPSLSPRVFSDSCPLSRWCYITISSSAASFSFCLQSFPTSWSFPMSWFFASDGQIIKASASVLLMNSQGWFPLESTRLISLPTKGLSRVFSNTLVKKLYSSSSLSAIRVVSSVYLSLLLFLPAILISACDPSSLEFHIMYSVYKLNKQADNIHSWHTPFPISKQSIVPCLVLTIASGFFVVVVCLFVF